MRGRTSAGRNPWPWAAIVLLVALLAWLVPNPLPWRSPLQGSGHRGIAAGPSRLDLAAGAEAVAHTTRSVPPAPTPEPSRPPAAPAVPAAFKGNWHGHGTNFVGSGNFDTAVTFPQRTARLVVATASFPTYGCQEAWRLQRSTPTTLTLQATLASGLCVARPLTVSVKLLDARHIYVQWRLENGVVESDATLTRV